MEGRAAFGAVSSTGREKNFPLNGEEGLSFPIVVSGASQESMILIGMFGSCILYKILADTVNTDPSPYLDFTVTSPPRALANLLQMDNPRPEP